MKLVRDYIPKIIERDGKTCEYHVAEHDEFKLRLYEKLREEFDEFIDTPCLEEAGDIYEVFLTILKLHNINFCDVVFAAQDKKDKNGGFEDCLILESVNNESETFESLLEKKLKDVKNGIS